MTFKFLPSHLIVPPFLLLAIETSSKKGSVALLRSKTRSLLNSPPSLLSEKIWDSESHAPHSEVITVFIPDCLKQAGVKFSDLNGLAVSLGPGSFTGLRVGVNVARSLAFSLSLPILAVNSLRVLAQATATKKENIFICSLINAYRQEFYSAFFQKKEKDILEMEVPCLLKTEELMEKIQKTHSKDSPFLCFGDGYCLLKKQPQFPLIKKHLKRVEGEFDFPLARHLGEAALQDQGQNPPLVWRELKPLYLRASSAEEKLEKNKD